MDTIKSPDGFMNRGVSGSWVWGEGLVRVGEPGQKCGGAIFLFNKIATDVFLVHGILFFAFIVIFVFIAL